MTSISNLWQTLKRVILSKHSPFIFLMFFVFFPLKTQFHNLLFISIDAVLNNGRVSEVYTFNYLGQLIGCKELGLVMVELGQRFDTFIYSFQILTFIISVFSFLFLIHRRQLDKNFSYLDWILLIVFCFSVVDSIEYILLVIKIPEYDVLKNGLVVTTFIISITMVCLAAYLILFKIKKHLLLQIGLVALPSCILSLVVWYFYLGPYILPLTIQ